MPPESTDSLLRRLRWTILRPLAVHLGGDERSLFLGPGLEFAGVREYQPGDDVRRIDWSVTARAGAERPFMREAQVERALDIWLLVDTSASVDWGTARCLKRDLAAEFTAVVLELLGRHGHRLGALLFAERPLGFVPPGAGRHHLLRLIACVRDEPRQASRGRTDLAAALAQTQAVVRRRALLLLVSDFLAPDGWQTPLRRLALRHEVVAVVLRDPREQALPDVGVITLEDPETGEQLTVDTADRRLRERFQLATRRQEEHLRRELARCGVDQVTLGTDRALLPDLVRFVDLRRRRRAGPLPPRVRPTMGPAIPG